MCQEVHRVDQQRIWLDRLRAWKWVFAISNRWCGHQRPGASRAPSLV